MQQVPALRDPQAQQMQMPPPQMGMNPGIPQQPVNQQYMMPM